MGSDTLGSFSIPVLSVDSYSGARIQQILVSTTAFNSTVAIIPRVSSSDTSSIGLYTRTAVFAILCVLVVFIMSIYCQGSIRNAFRQNNEDGDESPERLRHTRNAEMARVLVDTMPVTKFSPE